MNSKDPMFQGGGTSIASLMNQPQMGQQMDQQQQMAQQQMAQQQMYQQQMAQQQQMYQQQMAPQQQHMGHQVSRPIQKKREYLSTFGRIKEIWKNVLLLFLLCFIILNEKTYYLQKTYIRTPEQYSWLIFSLVNSILLVVVYFIISETFFN